jgi:hypothetical protein
LSSIPSKCNIKICCYCLISDKLVSNNGSEWFKNIAENYYIYRVYPNSTDKLSGQILWSKISIKLLIHMRSKMLSLRDNRLKISTSNKRNRLEFFDETNKNKKKLRTIHKNCQLTRLRFYHNNKYWPLLGGYTFWWLIYSKF